ncbi:MAG: hypothetical protein ACOVQA_15480 [Thermoflexibacteraceae bacterium]
MKSPFFIDKHSINYKKCFSKKDTEILNYIFGHNNFLSIDFNAQKGVAFLIATDSDGFFYEKETYFVFCRAGELYGQFHKASFVEQIDSNWWYVEIMDAYY